MDSHSEISAKLPGASCYQHGLIIINILNIVLFRSSPKEDRRSTQPVSTDNEDSEDETGKLTHSPASKVPTAVDGIDNHDEFTRYSFF